MTPADLLELRAVDAAAIDDRGSAIAVVVQRARHAGEPIAGESLYGGNVRADVIVFDAANGRMLFRTHGAAEHAGYWRPVWSPGGRALAMIALHDDTMSVCVWHRDGGRLSCLPEGGSIDFLSQWSVGTNADGHRRDDTPFAWLSDSTLAFTALPAGELDPAAVRSRLIADSVAAGWTREQRGEQPTGSVLDAPQPVATGSRSATIRVVNIGRGSAWTIASIPYLRSGFRRIVVDPTRGRAAVLADAVSRTPGSGVRVGFYNQVHTALGLLDLSRGGGTWWPERRPYTAFARWSPDGRRVGVMVKRSDDENIARGTRLFIIDAETRAVDSSSAPASTDAALRWRPDAGDADTGCPLALGLEDHILATAPRCAFAVVLHRSAEATAVRQITVDGESSRLLLELNARTASIANSARTLIAYTARDGSVQHGAVLLPPSFRAGVRYPVVTWVYPGMLYADTLDGQWLRQKDDPFPLNPNLLAGRGYVVLFPSMPMPPVGRAGDPYAHMLDGIDAALDTLIVRGIADSTRLAVIGQSYGGYAVNCIVSQTHRFRAAVSLAGIADLTSFALGYTPDSRYTTTQPVLWLPWAEAGQGRMGSPPWRDVARYVRNSPITHVDSVHVPILLTGGDNDYVNQAEEWFIALTRAGKRARLIRYWGGQHVLYSPANIVHLWAEIFAWFDMYLRPGQTIPVDLPPRSSDPSAGVGR